VDKVKKFHREVGKFSALKTIPCMRAGRIAWCELGQILEDACRRKVDTSFRF